MENPTEIEKWPKMKKSWIFYCIFEYSLKIRLIFRSHFFFFLGGGGQIYTLGGGEIHVSSMFLIFCNRLYFLSLFKNFNVFLTFLENILVFVNDCMYVDQTVFCQYWSLVSGNYVFFCLCWWLFFDFFCRYSVAFLKLLQLNESILHFSFDVFSVHCQYKIIALGLMF